MRNLENAVFTRIRCQFGRKISAQRSISAVADDLGRFAAGVVRQSGHSVQYGHKYYSCSDRQANPDQQANNQFSIFTQWGRLGMRTIDFLVAADVEVNEPIFKLIHRTKLLVIAFLMCS
jgi:hypothetical protein